MRNSAVVVIAALLMGCPIPMWPHLPEAGTCRDFRMTTWGGGAPWSEVSWGPGKDVVWVDEPMLPMWGWDGDLNNPQDVCGEKGIGNVEKQIWQLRIDNPNSKVWLNWSTEEWNAVVGFCTNLQGIMPGLGADILSIDSYGGVWDWEIHTRWRLDHIHRLLEPGQMMGLVPEGHYAPDWGVDWSPIDYVMINTLYFDYAFRRDRVYAMAPFTWGPCADGKNLCIADQPQLRDLLSDLQRDYPLCATQ